ncbi:MAG TPA: hypothetical protein VF100_11115 [Thermoanaerobaculia bacterium]
MPAAPTSPPSLAERVRRGDRELARLAARGLLPLPPAELVPLQVELAAGGDAELAAAARASLAALDPRLAAAHVARGAATAELAFFAAESRDRRVLEALIRRRDVPRRLLVELAPRLSPDLQEALVRRQDALVEEPAIVEALEANPQLSPEVRRRLAEYRRHLLRTPGAAPAAGEPAAEPHEAARAAEPADEEMRQARAAAAAAPAGDGEREESTGLTEAQVRMLPVPVRMKLARGASRPLRNILVRDPNPVVARAVMRGNTFSDQEIEAVAANRSVDEEVLLEISRRREWIGQYRVALALIKNPRTPLALAVRLVNRLAVRDLRLLQRDHNVADAVRSTARRLYTIKRV